MSSEYTIGLRDQVTAVAGRMRSELLGLRDAARAVPDVRVEAPGARAAASSMRGAASAARELAGSARATATSSVAASGGISGWISRARAYVSSTRQMARAKREFNREQREAMRAAAPQAPGAMAGGSTMGGMLAGAAGGLVTAGALFGVQLLNRSLRNTVGTVHSLTQGFGRATVAAHDFRVRTTLAFQGMGRDGEQAMAQLKGLAAEMGVSYAESFDTMRKLSAAGFDEAGIEHWYKRIQDAQWMGFDSEALRGMADGVMRIKDSGKVQGDEFETLKRSGMSMALVWQTIADHQGVSLDALKKLKGEGKISAEAALAGLEAGMRKLAGGKAAGELGKEMGAKTATGFMAMVGVVRESFFDSIAQSARGPLEGMWSSLSDAANDALSWMDSRDGRGFFDELGGGIKMVADDVRAFAGGDGIRNLMRGFRDVGVAVVRFGEGAWTAAKAFGSGLLGDGNFDSLNTLSAALTSIGKKLQSDESVLMWTNVGKAVGWAADKVLKFMSFQEGMKHGSLADMIEGTSIGDAASGLGERFGSGLAGGIAKWAATGALKSLMGEVAYSALSDLRSGGEAGAQSLVDGFVSGLRSRLPLVVQGAIAVGQAALSSLMGSLDAHSPSRAAFKIGGWTTEGLGGGMVANDNARRAASTVAGDVRAELSSGLGVGAGSSSSVTNQIGGDVVSSSESSSRTVSVVINVAGSMDAAAQADLERQVTDLFARVA